MSRIGKLPISVPDKVSVEIATDVIRVRGPRGELSFPALEGIDVAVEGGSVHVTRRSDEEDLPAKHGLVRASLNNMIKGVSQGFERRLEIEGVGYKADVVAQDLVLTIGFSHPIVYRIPDGIKIVVDKLTKVSVQGIDRQKVGQVAANLRSFRPPDSYKGKGIRYEGEKVRIKAGKSATK
jgi:large subunit ribosomal protein L6